MSAVQQVESAFKLDVNLETPFIKVVQESIVKTFKNHKKYIEKEVSTLVNKITLLKKTGSIKGSKHVVDNLEALITKLTQVKANYQKLIDAEDRLMDVMRKRLTHLASVLENQSNADIMKEYFAKRLNRIILDYMLRENYFESADTFIQESGLKDFADVEVFEEASRILDRLKKKDCKEALEWCNTHKTKLSKSNSQLEFKLRVQEFVELIRSNELLKAIEYSKKQLSKFDQDAELLTVLSKVMGFVAFRQDRRLHNANYKFYADEKRWSEIEDLFLKESFSLYGQPETPMIAQTLQTGIPVLKMEFCQNENTFTDQCPTCTLNIRKLGQKLPYSHHSQTCIQCKVTGEFMNDQNQPLFLPTGYVVSQRALEKLEEKPNKQVICPFTNQSINKGEIRKVFFS